MTTRARTFRMTCADYARLPDDGRRYQLVDREVVLTPSPSLPHLVPTCSDLST